MKKCLITKFGVDGSRSVSTVAPKKGPTKRTLLVAEIAAGRVKRALCRATPWQAEERLVIVDGKPGFDLGEGEFLPISEAEAGMLLSIAARTMGPLWIKCHQCDGTGADGIDACPFCGGRGHKEAGK